MEDFTKDKEEIKKLKEDLELKEKVFALLKANNLEKVKEILKDNTTIMSYFIKFKNDPDKADKRAGKVAQIGFNGNWDVSYNPHDENEIQEDLNIIRRGIREREYLLQQKVFLEKQQEFLEVQKKDITENKKDREKINNFTFIIAIGTLGSILYYASDLFSKTLESNWLKIELGLGIGCIALLIIFIVMVKVIESSEEMKIAWRKSKFLRIVIYILGVTILIMGVVIILNAFDTNKPTENLVSITSLNQEIHFLTETIRNSSRDTNIRLEMIILNQNNLTNQLEKMISNKSSS